MGIIFRQSFKNALIIYLGFLIGGINTIVFYPEILKSEYYGMVTFLLSASNLVMPLTALGVHFTIIKFFSSYKTKEEKDKFLSVILFFPLVIALPLGYFWDQFHTWIITRLADKNQNIENYTFSIYIIAVCCAYFEVFYSWAKVQLQTVFGNVLKEFWNRAVVLILLLFVYFNIITKEQFIWFLTGAYILRTLVMMGYAFGLYFPKFNLQLPNNFSDVMRYSVYIILAGSAGAILLDIDKVMIPGKDTIEKAAYYAVAVFIGSFVEAPSRAMQQILQPLTSKTLNENNEKEIGALYKKSSINLLVIGGLFFLLVNCGVHELFKLMPEKGYAGGEWVVLMISFVKLYTMFLGNNGAIINNSKHYRIIMLFGVGMAITVYFLNKWFYFSLELGTNGLALATLCTVLIFNSLKLLFVKSKFNITPFTNKTWQIILIIVVLFFSGYFWNFDMPSVKILNREWAPLFNILFKSILIITVYLFLVIRLTISQQIVALFNKMFKIKKELL